MTIPWNKGKKGIYSKETLKKMSLAKKGKTSPRKGSITSEETKRKQSLAHLGISTWNKGLKQPEVSIRQTGEKNSNWKGDKVKYQALHTWLRRQLGNAKKCENKDCYYPRKGANGKLIYAPKIYHWSNISKQYKRDLNDWQQLCPSCHEKYDRFGMIVVRQQSNMV